MQPQLPGPAMMSVQPRRASAAAATRSVTHGGDHVACDDSPVARAGLIASLFRPRRAARPGSWPCSSPPSPAIQQSPEAGLETKPSIRPCRATPGASRIVPEGQRCRGRSRCPADGRVRHWSPPLGQTFAQPVPCRSALQPAPGTSPLQPNPATRHCSSAMAAERLQLSPCGLTPTSSLRPNPSAEPLLCFQAWRALQRNPCRQLRRSLKACRLQPASRTPPPTRQPPQPSQARPRRPSGRS